MMVITSDIIMREWLWAEALQQNFMFEMVQNEKSLYSESTPAR